MALIPISCVSTCVLIHPTNPTDIMTFIFYLLYHSANELVPIT